MNRSHKCENVEIFESFWFTNKKQKKIEQTHFVFTYPILLSFNIISFCILNLLTSQYSI